MHAHKSENQTQFAAEEPFYESPYVPQEPPEPVDPEVVAAAKKKKLRWVGAIGGILLTVISLGLLAVLRPTVFQQEELQPTPTPTLTAEQTRWQGELGLLKTRLDEIDPTKEYLTTPPVDFELRLEGEPPRL